MKLGAVYTATARRADDRTVSVRVALAPGNRYWYRFEQRSAVSPIGTFETAPRPRSGARVRFAVSGDADATPASNGRPAFNLYGVYGRMAAERNDFNVNLGDTIYSDSEVGGASFARTSAQKWDKYKLGLALSALRRLRASAGLYSHWDDHELVNDFSEPEHGQAIYRAGVTAFLATRQSPGLVSSACTAPSAGESISSSSSWTSARFAAPRATTSARETSPRPRHRPCGMPSARSRPACAPPVPAGCPSPR